jgi:hypothetical protein
MRTLLTILIIFILGLVQGQPVNLFAFPLIKNKGQTISSFIPDRWTLLDSTSGDLNGDNRIDIAFVIESKDSLTTFTHQEQQGEVFVEVNKSEKYLRRILLIILKDSLADNFNLIEQNNTIILCHEDRTKVDPFEDIKIENRILKIFYVAKSIDNSNGSASTYSFRYQDGEFLLIEAERQLYSEFPPMLEVNKFDFINKKWSVSKGDPDKGQKPKTFWKDLNNL